MPTDALIKIACISDVFYQDDARERLRKRIGAAKEKGAELAILPEIPLNRWAPATTRASDDDGEDPGGPRHQLQSEVAREFEISIVGGAIINDPNTKRRHNTALVFDARGELVGTFSKCHVPEEPGFWETSHYDQGTDIAPVFGDRGELPLPIGVQICSDINRPEASHILGAKGAELICNPRATEAATFHRWKPVFLANALTSACFVASVNRPDAEEGVLIGGASVVTSPRGEVLLETTDHVGVAQIDRSAIRQARFDYPGYLPVRAADYAAEWSAIADEGPACVAGYPSRMETRA